MKLKRKLVFLIFILTFFFSFMYGVNDEKYGVSFSVGFLTIDQIADRVESIAIGVGTLGLVDKEYEDFKPSFIFTFHYYLKTRLSFNLVTGIYASEGTVSSGWTSVKGTFKDTNFIFSGELTYYWLKKDKFKMYSGIGGAIRIVKSEYTALIEDTTTTKPTFHFCPIGLRVGEKTGFFIETGASYRGIISGGIYFSF